MRMRQVLRSIRVKLVAAFLAVVMLAILALGAVFYINYQLERVTEAEEESREFQGHLGNYLFQLHRISSALFVLAAGEEAHGQSMLADAESELAAAEQQLARYSWYNTSVNPQTLANAQALRQDLSKYTHETLSAIRAVSDLDPDADVDAAEAERRRAVLHLSLARAVMLSERANLYLSQAIEELRAAEMVLTSNDHKLVHTSNALLVAISVVTVLLAVIMSWLLAGSFVRRLFALREAAAAFGHGKFSARVSIKGQDEISELGLSFNRMADELQENTALRLSKEYVENIIHSMNNGLVVLDGNLQIELVNRFTCELFGYQAEELMGQPMSILVPGNPDPKGGGAGAGASSGKPMPWLSDEAVRSYDTELADKNGHALPVAISCAPMIDKRLGRKFVCAIEDISRRKALIDDLSRAKKEAEQATAAKSAFLAHMSHELRTPLNSILGYAQILLADSATTAKQRPGLTVMQQSGEHLLLLLDDILDISRIEAGRLEIRETDFDLPRFLDSVVAMFRIRADAKNLHFIFEALSDLPRIVRADERRLRQVLLNLLGNAIKFTEQGGVVLRVGAHHGMYRFQVVDTGIGIAPEQLSDIFEPFRQAGDVESTQGGVGLGLAITQRLVALMGGKLGVTSKLGEGSSFWVDLSLAEVEGVLEAKAVSHRLLGYQGARRKVLLVDDKAENREVLRNMLAPLGFMLCEAENGRQAVEAAVREQPDLILMDVKMPDMDGVQATRSLREIPEFRETPIFAISASAFDEDRDTCMAAGCTGFLAKPVRLDALTRTLGNALALTWEYEEPTAVSSDSGTRASALTLPSAENLMQLIDMAKRGDIKGLRRAVDELEQQNRAFKPMAATLDTFLKDYRIKQARELLESWLALAPGSP